MKQIVKRIVPEPVKRARVRMIRRQRTLREFVPAFAYDFQRYLRHSSSNGPFGTQPNLRSKITATYHNIEKGLSLPNPRPGFGERPIANLILFLSAYVGTYGYDDWVATPCAVLRSYRDFNLQAGVEVPHGDQLDALLTEAEARLPDEVRLGGTRTVERTDLERSVAGVGLEFFTTRSSVRQYKKQAVDRADIEFAAAAAQRAPAVCNRQFGRIYVYQDPADISQMLEVQGGAKGFSEELGGVAIITTDLRNFWAAGERSQAWVDGGLFAMNFILGLHARGLGTVCLNWSKTPKTDRRLREVANLPEEAVIIMLVGFGVLRDTYQVANSYRIPLNETLQLR